MTNHTPLRYPGGKSLMTQFFIDLIEENRMHNVSYAEPFAGGAGTAVNLLIQDNVDNIHINDANICIYSFWKSITEENERFVEKLMRNSTKTGSCWKTCNLTLIKLQKHSHMRPRQKGCTTYTKSLLVCSNPEWCYIKNRVCQAKFSSQTNSIDRLYNFSYLNHILFKNRQNSIEITIR